MSKDTDQPEDAPRYTGVVRTTATDASGTQMSPEALQSMVDSCEGNQGLSLLMGSMGELVAKFQGEAPPSDPKNAKGGSPLGLESVTPTAGPPRVPSRWETYSRETHGAIPRQTVVFEGLRDHLMVGKHRIIEYIESRVAECGPGAVVVCITPPTTGSLGDVEGKEHLFEAFTEVAIRRADGTWFEWDAHHYIMRGPTEQKGA